MLAIAGLNQFYSGSHILWDVNLNVREGSCTCLMGRNGMGKTTTVRSVMGMVRLRGGTIVFEGKALHGLPSYRVAQAGLGLVPATSSVTLKSSAS